MSTSSLATRNRNLWWADTLVRALAGAGVGPFVVSPGSRSAPLALAIHAAGLPHHVVLDERVAAYFALGHAKATGRAAAVVTTSGSAVANLLPACIEASESATPLVLLTADRPPALRGIGANQAIDQAQLFGKFVRGFADLPLPVPEASLRDRLLHALDRLMEDAATGPVHLNVPFEEPLDARLVPADASAISRVGRNRPLQVRAPEPGSSIQLLRGLESARRPLLVVGPWRAGPEVLEEVAHLARVLGAPVLADPLSGLRFGPGHDVAVAHYDAFLRASPGALADLAPDLVLRFGEAPTSKPLLTWLASLSCPHVLVAARPGRHHGFPNARLATGAPTALLQVLRATAGEAEAGWLERWQRVDAAAGDELRRLSYGGGAVARALVEALPDGALLWLGSSLPVRDADAFAPRLPKRLAVQANRGASGIDGVCAAAAGAAAADPDRRAALLIGDLSLQHDVGALAAVAEHAPHLTIVCVNNGGGSVFRHLQVRANTPDGAFERLFATPQRFDVGRAASAFGLAHLAIDGGAPDAADRLAGAMERPGGVVEVRLDGEREATERTAALMRAVTAAAEVGMSS